VIPAGCFVEAAEPLDVAELLELERLCFSHPWTARHFVDSMSDPPRRRVIVVRRAQGREPPPVVAYAVVRLAAGELQIDNVAVHPDWRRHGLGRWMMDLVLERGRRQGAEEAILEVRRGNRAARQLYESLGFRLLDTRRDYYQDPVEDALVMRKQLP